MDKSVDSDPRHDGARCILTSVSSLKDVLEGRLTVGAYSLLIGLPGRHGAQIEALFTKSGLFGDPLKLERYGAPDLKHNPFLTIRTDMQERTVRIVIVNNARDLLALADDVAVMAQWPGQHRSDWFHFTVSDFRAYIARCKDNAEGVS